MKCLKCGAELTDDTKFCSYCGAKVEEDTEMPPIPQTEEKNSDTNEDIRFDDSVYNEPISSQKSESKSNKVKDKFLEYWNKLSKFGKLATIGITVFTILALIAFLAGRIVAGILSIVQIAIVVVAILMKKNIIKVPKNWIPIVAVVVSFVLVIPYFSLFKINSADYVKYDWDAVVLAEMLPRPESPYGEIISNSEDYLSLDVTKTTEAQYKEYIEACKDKGFTIDTESSGSIFYAYNDKGYKLSLSYYDYNSEMHINLDSAMEMETITWPDSKMAKLLPAPKSTTGKIYSDDEDSFSVYIGNTTIDDYNAYVKACEEKGFTVDAQKKDKTFSAKNADSFKLSVDYKGNNVIYISVAEPEFDVTIEVECVENWIFSKYDVELSVDDEFEGTIPHGDKKTFDVVLKRGKHTISFESAEDDTLDGEVEVEITKNETIKLKISCSSFGVDVELLSGTVPKDDDSSKETTPNTEETQKPTDTAGAPDVWTNLLEKHYEDVKKQFEDAGFTNVTCVAHEIDFNENNVFEGSVVNIAVGENGEICTFEKGEQWPKNIKIRIDYRVKPAKPDTTKIVLPQEDSKLGKDLDTKGTSTIYYINTDNIANKPSTTTWGSATVTDGVAEYLDYLKDLGFTVTVTDTTHKEPYSGYHTYETNFKVSNDSVSWTMYLCIQKEQYVEYELDVHLN